MKEASGTRKLLITFVPWPTNGDQITSDPSSEPIGGCWRSFNMWKWDSMKHHEGGLWEQKCTNNFCSLTPQMGDQITSDPTSEAIGGRWRSFNMWKWDSMKHHEEQKCTNNFCSLTPQMGDRITSDPTSEAIGGHWRPLNSVQIVSKFFTDLYRVLLNMVNMASWSHQLCPPRPLEVVEHLWNKMCKEAGLRNGSFLFNLESVLILPSTLGSNVSVFQSLGILIRKNTRNET